MSRRKHTEVELLREWLVMADSLADIVPDVLKPEFRKLVKRTTLNLKPRKRNGETPIGEGSPIV